MWNYLRWGESVKHKIVYFKEGQYISEEVFDLLIEMGIDFEYEVTA